MGSIDHGLGGFDGFGTDLISENLSDPPNQWSIHLATQIQETTHRWPAQTKVYATLALSLLGSGWYNRRRTVRKTAALILEPARVTIDE